MDASTLELLWFLVICVAVIFYVILDGFDLGVGMLQLFGKTDEERRIFLNAIGPVWDGNEVWLVIVGGATFAGFPGGYATLCTAFYMPIMILLVGIIFRAVAIEFRSKVESPRWRQTWDIIFCISSYIMAFVFGVLLANLIMGIKIDENGYYVGTFWDFFTPYTILLGFTSVFVFIMHGTIFLFMKTTGDLHKRLKLWVPTSIGLFVITYILTTMATLIYMPHMTETLIDNTWLFVTAAIALLAIANIPREVYYGSDWRAFLSSCASIALLFLLFAMGTYPNLIRSSINPELYSITIHNASASPTTLIIDLIVVAIGIPLVLAYGYWVYRIFRGKVTLHETSY